MKTGLGAAAVAAVVLAGGCSAGQPAPAVAVRQSPAPPAGPPSTVRHWGSFFGAGKGVNYDLAKSPVAVQLPGTVTEIGTSNSTEYALLANGSLYAWGLGTQGELGDGGTVNSFTRPVRVRFPAGVRIASIPADAMPYNTGLAVDTQGRAWGWGLNGGGSSAWGTPGPTPLPSCSRCLT